MGKFRIRSGGFSDRSIIDISSALASPGSLIRVAKDTTGFGDMPELKQGLPQTQGMSIRRGEICGLPETG